MDTIYLFQSSPAPRRGRYVCFYLPSRLCNGFNPRPHQGAGATFIYLNMHRKIRVSILARTKARALHLVGFLAGSIIYVSILARTKARALPGDAIQKAYADGFQSSPAPRRGRYSLLPTLCPTTFKSKLCANPRKIAFQTSAHFFVRRDKFTPHNVLRDARTSGVDVVA